MARATLNGTVPNDGGEPADCYFEWGATAAYGMTTPVQLRIPSGGTFSQEITSLGEGREYHFRAVAFNSRGTSYGQDFSFVTPSPNFLMTLVDDDTFLRITGVL